MASLPPTPQPSTFLSLPQEVRDLIFRFAISEDGYDAHAVREGTHYRLKRIPIGTSDRWQWEAHHTSRPPIPEYLCLMLANRQLHGEIKAYLSRPQHLRPVEAKMTMLLEYPKLFATFTSLPQDPKDIRTLEMMLRVNHIFHPAYITLNSQNALLTAISDTLKRYIYRGPHLSRPSHLPHRLHLDVVRITISGLGPFAAFEDMKDDYGFVEPQVEALYASFMALLRRFARSGLPWGMIDAFEVSLEGKGKGWDRVPVTSNIWDEQDFVFFQYGGFNWDGGSDTTVVNPDQIAW